MVDVPIRLPVAREIEPRVVPEHQLKEPKPDQQEKDCHADDGWAGAVKNHVYMVVIWDGIAIGVYPSFSALYLASNRFFSGWPIQSKTSLFSATSHGPHNGL